jgi:hypothetical protein
MKYISVLFIALLASCVSIDGNKAVALFDGKTLDGWEALPGGIWEVKDGCIHGVQEKTERRHGMLISKKKFSDFEVKFKFKAFKGNSGFYFRVKKVKHYVSVKGFQAEIDATGKEIGGLYETLGRSWVVKPTKEQVEKYYKMKEWNDMKVRAVGRDVVIHVNGVKTAELKNDQGNVEGFFGLQLHGGQHMDVYYKDIEIKDLSQKTDAGQ